MIRRFFVVSLPIGALIVLLVALASAKTPPPTDSVPAISVTPRAALNAVGAGLQLTTSSPVAVLTAQADPPAAHKAETASTVQADEPAVTTTDEPAPTTTTEPEPSASVPPAIPTRAETTPAPTVEPEPIPFCTQPNPTDPACQPK